MYKKSGKAIATAFVFGRKSDIILMYEEKRFLPNFNKCNKSGVKNKIMETYIFKVNLLRKPKISREIEIPENTNLYKLAEAIVGAYNFDFDHCFGFFNKISENRYFDSERKYELFTDLIEEGENLEPTGAGSVKKTKINEVWQNPGDKMLFLFDYGDEWLFIVEFKGVGEKDQKKKYPRILKRVGKAPRQY